MNSCYLVIISRNTWSDYCLATELPSSPRITDAKIRMRIKSFFQIDYVDGDIEENEKVIAPNLLLHSWCGRINDFSLKGISCVDQVGRPIMLGVGIIQEFDDDNVVVRYSLKKLEPLLSQILSEFQHVKNYQARLYGLESLGISGERGLLSTLPTLNSSILDVETRITSGETESCTTATERLEYPFYAEDLERLPTRSDSWLDDLHYLVAQTVRVKNAFDSQAYYQNRRDIQSFVKTTQRHLEANNTADLEKKWRRVYQDLADAWRMPLDKKLLQIPLTIGNPAWICPNECRIDSAQRNIIEQQIDLLSTAIECKYSAESVFSRFERLANSFQEVLIDLLS